ncbi:MAG: DUF4269 domain-containing protein [Bacteroidales bacterium]
MDFQKIDYLKSGTEKQKRAYKALTCHSVISKLGKFDPILVGTIPINVDTDKSDLDIICHWKDKADFISTLSSSFKHEKDFNLSEKVKNGNEVVVAKFTIDEFPVEVYGQSTPTTEQNGYRHMIVEYKILQEKGEDFRMQIVELKKQGYKTEPAFAKLLGLENDPFQEILNFRFD